MKIYLSARHWQLFLVVIGSVFLVQELVAIANTNVGAFGSLALVLPVFIPAALFFGWLWSISSACFKALPMELAYSPKYMQASLIYALVYLVSGGVFFFAPGGHLPFYAIIMHLLAMAAIFYALAFTAKQLIKLEQGKDVSFFSYSGPFFLLWFFPLGVWFIQPKVNQLFCESKND